jgi:hypothetical protein
MGHDSAWKKAATVTTIAAMLPRSSKGLDDIASTTGIVEKSILLAENEIVTGRAQDEGYAILLRTTLFGGSILHQASILRPRSYRLRTPIVFQCKFSFSKHSFFTVTPGGWSIFPRPALCGQSSEPANAKHSRNYHFQEK